MCETCSPIDLSCVVAVSTNQLTRYYNAVPRIVLDCKSQGSEATKTDAAEKNADKARVRTIAHEKGLTHTGQLEFVL